MRYIALITIAAMFICIPLFAQESDTDTSDGSGEDTEFASTETDEASSGAATDAAAGCEKLHLGSWEDMETAEGEAESVEGEEVTDEEYLSDVEVYNQSQQQEEQKTEELLCEENPNPDGTITCYEGEKALTCQVQGEQILCPE